MGSYFLVSKVKDIQEEECRFKAVNWMMQGPNLFFGGSCIQEVLQVVLYSLKETSRVLELMCKLLYGRVSGMSQEVVDKRHIQGC